MCDNSLRAIFTSSIDRNNLVLSGPECTTAIVSCNTDVLSVACLRFQPQHVSYICAISFTLHQRRFPVLYLT